MGISEYFSLFTSEGDFSVEARLQGSGTVAGRRADVGVLSSWLKTPPCTLTFDEHPHDVVRYEIDPTNKRLLIHARPQGVALNKNQMLYERYLELVRSEIEEFGVKPTAIPHLMGRLGELHCALAVQGTLAELTNQPGFDVQSADGKKISVKTTAQVSGFVSISASTLQKADELMLVQYSNGQTTTIFYGSVSKAVTGTRMYEGRYELDIGRARKLALLSD